MARQLFKKAKPVEQVPTYTRPTARPEKIGKKGDPGPRGKRGLRGRSGKRGPQGALGPGGGLPNVAVNLDIFYRKQEYQGANVRHAVAIDPEAPELLEKSQYAKEESLAILEEGVIRVTVNGLHYTHLICSTPVDLQELVPEYSRGDGTRNMQVEYFSVSDDD